MCGTSWSGAGKDLRPHSLPSQHGIPRTGPAPRADPHQVSSFTLLFPKARERCTNFARMSCLLTLAAASPPSRDALVEALALSDLQVTAREGGDWDGVVHLARVGLSTRSTELSWKDGRFEVRVLSLAAPEDGALAVRTIEVAAELTGQREVETELHGTIPVAELAHTHDARWIESIAESGARTVATLIREGRGPLEIPGPMRSFYLGPRSLARLAGPLETLHHRLIEALRRVQWLEAQHPAASRFVARGDDGEGEFSFATWMGRPIFLPAVDRVLIDVGMGVRRGTSRGAGSSAGSGAGSEVPREVFLVPAEVVPELAGANFTPLDERQGTIDGYTETAWAGLVAAARRHTMD